MQRRNTPSQAAVLSLLKNADDALSHEMIEARITTNTSRSTIYRILNRFEEDGVVHRIIAEDGKQYFALCEECDHREHRDDHPHFRCLRCGRVECLAQSVRVEVPAGYRAEKLSITISGYCKGCSSRLK